MASSALARRDVQLARASASKSAAVARANARADQRIARMQNTLARARQSTAVSNAVTIGGLALGAVAGGQIARLTLFEVEATKDTPAYNRAHYVNYGAGVVAGAAIVSGKIRSLEAAAAAAVALGMALGQLAIQSKEQWDLVPGDMWGQPPSD